MQANLWRWRFSLSTIILSLYLFVPLTSYGDQLHLAILDVGQGDSILIRTPKGHNLLIDGGPDQAVISELSQVLPFWDRKIDVVIPTHPDADHITGLVSVIQRHQVDRILATGATKETEVFTALQQEIDDQAIPTSPFHRGQVLTTDDGLVLRSLWPESSAVTAASSANEASQVNLLQFQYFRALLTGDIGAETGRILLAKGEGQKVDVLKIPHHGSKTGLDPGHVRKIAPTIGVVSVGAKNRYGHPADLVAQLMAEVGARYYRTDVHGRVEIWVNQAGISLKASKVSYNMPTQ